MENSNKISHLDLHNEMEAGLLASVLDDRNIPHIIRSFSDTAYDGLFQYQMGWGQIEAAEEYIEEIGEILKSIREQD